MAYPAPWLPAGSEPVSLRLTRPTLPLISAVCRVVRSSNRWELQKIVFDTVLAQPPQPSSPHERVVLALTTRTMLVLLHSLVLISQATDAVVARLAPNTPPQFTRDRLMRLIRDLSAIELDRMAACQLAARAGAEPAYTLRVNLIELPVLMTMCAATLTPDVHAEAHISWMRMPPASTDDVVLHLTPSEAFNLSRACTEFAAMTKSGQLDNNEVLREPERRVALSTLLAKCCDMVVAGAAAALAAKKET